MSYLQPKSCRGSQRSAQTRPDPAAARLDWSGERCTWCTGQSFQRSVKDLADLCIFMSFKHLLKTYEVRYVFNLDRIAPTNAGGQDVLAIAGCFWLTFVLIFAQESVSSVPMHLTKTKLTKIQEIQSRTASLFSYDLPFYSEIFDLL